MSVLLYSDNFPPDVGGTPTLYWNAYSRISDTPVVVLTDKAEGAEDDASDAGMRVVRRGRTPDSWSVLKGPTRSYYLGRAREIHELSPKRSSVVHAGRALPEGVGALAAKTLHGIPYLVWVHGEELATAASSRELTWLTRRVHQNAAMLLTSSNNTKQLLAARGVTPSKISVAHPGVDTDRFSPTLDGASIRQRYAPGGERLLLTVGRLQRRKGHDLTIDAIARLVEKQRTVKYLIVGDGEERPALEQRVAKHGLSNHVMFAGIVPAGALPSYYAACDVFLMPNRIDAGDFEGFGIVFLEAAACGKPTIGGKSGGASEAVQDGETGMLVSGTDVDELAGAIDRLISSAELRSRFGGAGRERVLRQFTWNHTAAVVAEAQRRIRG